MNKLIRSSLATAFLSLGLAHASVIELPEYGFSIKPLDGVPPKDVPTTPLITFLPSKDGFSANINVAIQPYGESMTEYIALSKKQFAELKLEVLSEKTVGENEWVVEYKGPIRGEALHFFARAIAREGKVYLVTATAQESRWEELGDQLREHVHSFQLK